jgi:tRNA threonylcarbamoyladenosine biosynthesis protein TsaB
MYLFISTENNYRFSLISGTQNRFAIKVVTEKFRQSEKLLSEIAKLIQSKKIKGIMVVSGPGEFSGLRIGIATANALAYAWQVPVLGVRIASDYLETREQLLKYWNQGLKKIVKLKKITFVKPFYGREPNINKGK